jgi:hypothetical protein
MVSEQYSGGARTLRPVAGDMTDQAIASRLSLLAEDCERCARKAELARFFADWVCWDVRAVQF